MTSPTGDTGQPLPDLLAACMEAVEAGDLPAALVLADRALAMASPVGGVAFANAVLLRGLVDQAADNLPAAQDAYTDAACLAGPHLAEPDGAQVYVHAQTELAALHRTRGHYQLAEQVLKQALAAASVADAAAGPEDLAQLHNELGVVSKFTGDFGQATDHYTRALTLLQSVLPDDHTDLATLWHNIAGLAHAQGDYQAAEEPARRSVTIREHALGPDHVDVAADRAALAPILMGLDRLEEAEALLRAALTIFERAYGPSHPEYAITLGNLAALIHQRGDYHTADPLYHQARVILENSLGPDHPDLAAILANHAELRSALGDPDTAGALDARATAILTGTVQPDHPTLTTINRRAT
jgi:tetratricopeptide (TPR) repeat protein